VFEFCFGLDHSLMPAEYIVTLDVIEDLPSEKVKIVPRILAPPPQPPQKEMALPFGQSTVPQWVLDAPPPQFAASTTSSTKMTVPIEADYRNWVMLQPSKAQQLQFSSAQFGYSKPPPPSVQGETMRLPPTSVQGEPMILVPQALQGAPMRHILPPPAWPQPFGPENSLIGDVGVDSFSTRGLQMILSSRGGRGGGSEARDRRVERQELSGATNVSGLSNTQFVHNKTWQSHQMLASGAELWPHVGVVGTTSEDPSGLINPTVQLSATASLGRGVQEGGGRGLGKGGGAQRHRKILPSPTPSDRDDFGSSHSKSFLRDRAVSGHSKSPVLERSPKSRSRSGSPSGAPPLSSRSKSPVLEPRSRSHSGSGSHSEAHSVGSRSNSPEQEPCSKSRSRSASPEIQFPVVSGWCTKGLGRGIKVTSKKQPIPSPSSSSSSSSSPTEIQSVPRSVYAGYHSRNRRSSRIVPKNRSGNKFGSRMRPGTNIVSRGSSIFNFPTVVEDVSKPTQLSSDQLGFFSSFSLASFVARNELLESGKLLESALLFLFIFLF